MAKNRYVGDYPVIGIRPIVDGRRGPQMMRESLEPLVWARAESAKKLFEEAEKTAKENAIDVKSVRPNFSSLAPSQKIPYNSATKILLIFLSLLIK